MRLRALIIGLMLVVAACGGSDDTAADDGGTVDGGADTTVTTTAGDDTAATTTTTADTGGSDDGGSTGGDFSTAVVTIGGDTYEFRASDFPAEVCNTNFFGGVQIVLAMADDSGTMLTDGGKTSVLGIVLLPPDTSEDAPMVEFGIGATDVEWIANADSLAVSGSSVNDWSVDGDTVRGTATFVSDVGDGPTDGTFEATCVE